MYAITTFRWAPFAQGLVRDLRLRWALEEMGAPYEVRTISREDQTTPAYRALQPFGQAPVLHDDGFSLFESGAILLHLGKGSEALLPTDEAARARATAWLFAALNSIEPFIQQLVVIDVFCAGEEWAKLRRPQAEEMVRRRLTDLSAALGERDYLEERFTAGDLMMTTVLRILRHTDLVAEHANLKAYMKRCEGRPAFQRALSDQIALFAQHAPAN